MPIFSGLTPPENNFSHYTATSIKTAEERREAVIKNEKVLEAIDRRITSRGPDPPMSEMTKEPATALDLAPLLLKACDEGDTELIDGLLHKGADPNFVVDLSMYQTEGDLSARNNRRRKSQSDSTSIVVVGAETTPDPTPLASPGASTSNNCASLHLKVPPNNYFRQQSPSPLSQSPKSRSPSNSNSRSGSRPVTPPGAPSAGQQQKGPNSGGNNNPTSGSARRGSSSFSSGIFPPSSVVKSQKEDNIPLIRACYSGRTAAVISLLEAGADPNFTLSGTGDITPLRIAVAKGIPLMIEALVTIGRAMVNAPNSVGRTPLHFACELGNVKCCEMLAKLGASNSLRDNFGSTPIQLVHPESEEASAIQVALRFA